MKASSRKIGEREPDDSLFGLLASYKACNTYFRLTVNEEKKRAIFEMTDNPRFFAAIYSDDNDGGFRLMKRTEMKINKLSVKYISPVHVLEHLGENLGLKLTSRSSSVSNTLNGSEKVYHLEIPLSQTAPLIHSLKKIVNLTPQKKYEIIEKYLANTMKPEAQE